MTGYLPFTFMKIMHLEIGIQNAMSSYQQSMQKNTTP